MDTRNASLAFAFATAMTLVACDHQSTEQAKQDAVKASRKVENVLERTGEKIADASRKAAAEVKEAAHDAKDKTVAAGHEAKADMKDATADARSTDTGRVMSDTAITASIKTDYLKDPDLSVLKIDVDTKDGVVTLNGLAANDAAKQRAEKLAAANKGVKEVRNFLAVKQG